MRKTLLDLAKLVLPQTAAKQRLLVLAWPHVTAEQLKQLEYYLKMDKLFGIEHDFGTTAAIGAKGAWVEFKTHVGDGPLRAFCLEVSNEIKSAVDEESFQEFSGRAGTVFPSMVANNIVGMEREKLLAALLLFAKEPFHILLLGDPGTGKTEILRSISALGRTGSFGLGSGTSAAGLGAAIVGGEVVKGLLPLADGGIACIDELNLMTGKDQAALYNAMEKGFVTIDKGGKHEQLAAHVRVIATANPTGDKFIGQGVAVLKKQLPFPDALLSRFHMILIVRRPDAEELGEITRKIIAQEKQASAGADLEYLKAYQEWSWGREVALRAEHEDLIARFIKALAEDEEKFLVDIGPRTAVGTIRLAKA